MDIETLKAVAEIISNLSGDTREVFLWYFTSVVAISLIGKLLTILCIGFVTTVLVRFFRYLVCACVASDRLLEAANHRKVSHYKGGSAWSKRDILEVCEFLRENYQPDNHKNE